MDQSHSWAETYRDCVEQIVDLGHQFGWTIDSRSLIDHEHYRTTLMRLGPERPRKLLVVTSGLHGVEGFLGSAIQSMLVRHFSERLNPSRDSAVLMVHAINPFGFDQLRRFDENNVDLNRNFLLSGEEYQGANEGYHDLNRLLNPPSWPRFEIPFTLQASWKIARHGLNSLQQAVAEGQYDYPSGLFFGGREPTQTLRALEKVLLPEIQSTPATLHLDIHSGLGLSGEYQFLFGHELSPGAMDLLKVLSGNRVKFPDEKMAYQAKGNFNRWIRHHAPMVTSVCLEYGTFPPVKVLSALRAENAAHHWGEPDSNPFTEAKNRLKEVFFPSSRSWRSRVYNESKSLFERVFDLWLNQ
ncbi:M14 family metallopeptidase [Thalassoglobus neptunius]|uniref:M14 family metallopeptidase n=1 Tax=Thalassoglobus neptunius TaxID=1938619 RepID=UPI0018D20B89|nr:M14 family metallopeptidase [Thalassoglobus neptunius]